MNGFFAEIALRMYVFKEDQEQMLIKGTESSYSEHLKVNQET